jgi:Uncharacterized protein conserved in bacteria
VSMRPRLRPPSALATIVLCAALAGCGSLFGPSAPIQYFTLTPTATADASLPSFGNRIVAVQTARLPEYLNQNGIVTRTETNALSVSRDNQWAGSLDSNVTNVIVTDLARILGSTKVVAFPVSAALPVDRVVHVDVSRFEQEPSGSVTLSAQWTIFGDGGRTYLDTDSGSYTVAGVDRSYAAITAAMSRLLGSLSLDIAQTLTATTPPGAASAR